MQITLYFDPEDGNAQHDKMFDTFDGATEYIEGLKRQAENEARREESERPPQGEAGGDTDPLKGENQTREEYENQEKSAHLH